MPRPRQRFDSEEVSSSQTGIKKRSLTTWFFVCIPTFVCVHTQGICDNTPTCCKQLPRNQPWWSWARRVGKQKIFINNLAIGPGHPHNCAPQPYELVFREMNRAEPQHAPASPVTILCRKEQVAIHSAQLDLSHLLPAVERKKRQENTLLQYLPVGMYVPGT